MAAAQKAWRATPEAQPLIETVRRREEGLDAAYREERRLAAEHTLACQLEAATRLTATVHVPGYGHCAVDADDRLAA